MITDLVTSLSSLQVRQGAILGSHWPELDNYYTIDEIMAILADYQLIGGIDMQIVQIQKAEYTGHASTSTTMPIDDTIPQITEGGEFMTLAITPQSLDNYLLIMVHGWFASVSASNWLSVALFNLAVHATDAIAVTGSYIITGTTGRDHNILSHQKVTSLNSNVLKVRAGCNFNSTGFNGSGSRNWGLVQKSSIIAMEISV